MSDNESTCTIIDDLLEFIDEDEWEPDVSPPPRGRAWVATINNYTIRNVQNIRALVDGTTVRRYNVQAKYVVFNREIAPTTGTPHLQCYLQFTTSVRRDYVNRAICCGTPCHVFLELAKGNKRKNREYCTKSDSSDPAHDPSWEEHGDIEGHQGKRKDLEEWTESIIKGDTIDSAIEQEDYRFLSMVVKFKKGYDTLRQKVEQTKREMPTVYWFHGPTGSGKSHTAMEMFPNAFWYSEYGSGQWWDGYEDQEAVVLDDIRPESFQYRFLLRLFDKYPMRVGCKGYTKAFVAKNIIVTAPKPPREFYENYINEDIGQLLRRISHIREFEIRVEN